MKLLLRNTKENCNKGEKQEEDNLKVRFNLTNNKLFSRSKKFDFYLSSFNFLTRFIPTPETASNFFSSAAITAFGVLNPAS